MELLGTSTIIGYILSTFSMKYVLVDDEDKSQKKIVFDLIYFISLVLFTIYTYLLMQDFYPKFNFIVSLNGKAILTDPNLQSGTDRIYAAIQKLNNFNQYGDINSESFSYGSAFYLVSFDDNFKHDTQYNLRFDITDQSGSDWSSLIHPNVESGLIMFSDLELVGPLFEEWENDLDNFKQIRKEVII